jgi:hypothetical protein
METCKGKAMWRNTAWRFMAAVFVAAATICAGAESVIQDKTFGIEFSHPDRIRYDNRSLIIDGKPIYIYSGAMHYFRCPRGLWKDRLQKLKDAGLNCVETYVAWNLHEPEEPANPDDFSKLRDMEQISDFIQAARDMGLYVIIRPGPYICAEVDRGGLPGWLMNFRPDGLRQGRFLRDNSSEMLAWDRHWLTAAAKVIKPHLISNVPKGSTGVILWQLENEYDWNGAGIPSDVRADVLSALAHTSLDSGIDVPLFTCETMDKAFREDPFLRSHVFNTVNKYPNYDMEPLIKGIEDCALYQPARFRAVTELQGGWFSQVGGSLSGGHNAAQITQLTLTAIERGCTSLNYYMFYGGSNFGYAAPTITQTYDYNAPLREWGGEGDRYFAVKAIGRMLKEHGDQLIHSDPVALTIEGDHKDVSIYLRRSDDGSQFFFVRNAQQSESRSATVKVKSADGPEQSLSYNLGDFGAKVLYVPPGASDLTGGEWLPKPVERPDAAQSIPAPAPVRIASIACEEPADDWREVHPGKQLESAGIFDQRYVYYRVKFNLSADDLAYPLALFIRSDGGGDCLTVRINGTQTLCSKDGYIDLDKRANEGSNTAEILFENLGCPNFGPVIELRQGITHISLVPEQARAHAVEGWRMRVVKGNPPDLPEIRANFDDHDWPAVRLDEPAANTPAGMRAVYRATLPISKQWLAAGVAMTFGTIDDRGTIYVNGQKAGSADDWSHPWTFDITQYLQEGNNNIALLVQNDYGPGGPYKGCDIEPIGRALDGLQVSPATSVTEGAIGQDTPRRLLVHYTMEFQLPRTASTLSASWKLHLDADANAFMTLNGHPMGRYWAVGPQRDVWLPECWLKFGSNEVNIVELQARPTVDAPVGKIIKLVEVRPFVESTNAASRAP